MADETISGLGAHKMLLAFGWALWANDATVGRVFDSERLRALVGPELAEWRTVERFLAPYSRVERRRLCADVEDDSAPLALAVDASPLPCQIVISRYESQPRVLGLSLFTTLSCAGTATLCADVDVGIGIVQALQGRNLDDGDGRRVHGMYRGERVGTVGKAVALALQELSDGAVDELPKRSGWCIEFRSEDGGDAKRPVEADPRPFYGLAVGDEGWRHVPHSVACERLGRPWSTRTFVAAYPLGPGIVCINNKSKEYVRRQDEFMCDHFGRLEPYFSTGIEVAGLDHGPLLVLERVVSRQALADHWINEAQREPSPGEHSTGKRRLLRSSLDDVLNFFQSGLLREIDPLERTLIENLGLERLVAQLDRQAEAIDDEIRYEYESLVSSRVERLTRVAIVLTVVTMVLGVLQVVVPLLTGP